jgi:hypothetical protein
VAALLRGRAPTRASSSTSSCATIPSLARRLASEEKLPATELALPPEAEARALLRMRDLLNGRRWLRGLRLTALALTGLAVARVIEYTTWNETSRLLVANGVVAALA